MQEISQTEPLPYTPPGWVRGFVLLVLFVLATIMLVVAVIVPMIFAGFQMVETAPYTYPVTGNTDADAVTLKDAVVFGTLPIAITGFLLLPLFTRLHKKLVKQPLSALIGPRHAFRRDFTYALGFVALFWGPALIYGFTTTERDPILWISAAPIAALILFAALPLQAYAEELIFRGYLQSWFTTRLGSAVFAAYVQSVLFALIHPGALAETFILAMTATTVTLATKNIGAATAIHLTNNLSIYLLSYTPARDGEILSGFQFVSPLPFGFSIGVAINLLCILVLPKLLASRQDTSGLQRV